MFRSPPWIVVARAGVFGKLGSVMKTEIRTLDDLEKQPIKWAVTCAIICVIIGLLCAVPAICGLFARSPDATLAKYSALGSWF